MMVAEPDWLILRAMRNNKLWITLVFMLDRVEERQE